MKLLVVTQTVDTEDPILGFFVRWIEEFAKRAESIEVICLKEGAHALPMNVRVHSLGKEKGASRAAYIFNFYRYIWRLRRRYDAVFVHMNEEYILLGGEFWRLSGKPVYLWRNHYAGTWRTGLAVFFCTKMFCTSRYSYTARYKKTILMPVGVDTERFRPDDRIRRMPRSILFLARMSPSKRPEILVDALAELARQNADFSATFVGSPLSQDAAYYEGLKEKVRTAKLADRVTFLPAIPNSRTPDLYRAHQIFVNTSPSGMLDKTIFEAAASGCSVLAASKDFAAAAGYGAYVDSARALAERLAVLLAEPDTRPPAVLVEQNSLSVLAEKLIGAMIAHT